MKFQKNTSNYVLAATIVGAVGVMAVKSCRTPQHETIVPTITAPRECPSPVQAPVVTPPNNLDGRCEAEKGESNINSPLYDRSCGRCGDGIRQVATSVEVDAARNTISSDAGVPVDSGLAAPSIVVTNPPNSTMPSPRVENAIYYRVVPGIVSESPESCPIDFLSGNGRCDQNVRGWITTRTQVSAQVNTDAGVVLRPTTVYETDGGITPVVAIDESDQSNPFSYSLDCYHLPTPQAHVVRAPLPGCNAIVGNSEQFRTTAPNLHTYRVTVEHQIANYGIQIRNALRNLGKPVTDTSELSFIFSVVLEPDGNVGVITTSISCGGRICGTSADVPTEFISAPINTAAPHTTASTRCMWTFSAAVPEVRDSSTPATNP